MRALHAVLDRIVARGYPARRIGLRLMKEQLIRHGVTVPLAPGCLRAYVSDAQAEARSRKHEEGPYAERLARAIAQRAQFIRNWTQDVRALDGPQEQQLVGLARRYSIPRAWRVAASPTAAPPRRPESFKIPAQLLVSSPVTPDPGGQSSLPGAAVLAALERSAAAAAPTRPFAPAPSGAVEPRARAQARRAARGALGLQRAADLEP